MIRDVAAAIGVVERYARAPQHFFVRQQVFQMSVAAQRNDMGMLHQQKLVWNQALLALFHQLLLNEQCLVVAQTPEIANENLRH